MIRKPEEPAPPNPEISYMEPDERLVRKLEPMRRGLVIPDSPNPTSPLLRLYRSVSSFDPFLVQVGQGYRQFAETYDEAVKIIAEDTEKATPGDFAILMNMEAMTGPASDKYLTYRRRPNTIPFITFSTRLNQSRQFYQDGYVLTVAAPRKLLIDHNKTRARFGWDAKFSVEERIYLYGPVHPSWIIGISSRIEENEQLEDNKRAQCRKYNHEGQVLEKCDSIRTRCGLLILLRSGPDYFSLFNQSPREISTNHLMNQADNVWRNPVENEIEKIAVPQIQKALRRVILLDGAGKDFRFTYKPGIKPLVCVQTLTELKTCLDAFAQDGLVLGGQSPQQAWEQVEKYFKNEIYIHQIEDPYVQMAVVSIGHLAVLRGETKSSAWKSLSK